MTDKGCCAVRRRGREGGRGTEHTGQGMRSRWRPPSRPNKWSCRARPRQAPIGSVIEAVTASPLERYFRPRRPNMYVLHNATLSEHPVRPTGVFDRCWRRPFEYHIRASGPICIGLTRSPQGVCELCTFRLDANGVRGSTQADLSCFPKWPLPGADQRFIPASNVAPPVPYPPAAEPPRAVIAPELRRMCVVTLGLVTEPS